MVNINVIYQLSYSEEIILMERGELRQIVS